MGKSKALNFITIFIICIELLVILLVKVATYVSPSARELALLVENLTILVVLFLLFWINRNNLNKFNINKWTILIFIVVGGAGGAFFLPSSSNWFLVACFAIIILSISGAYFFFYRSNLFRFDRTINKERNGILPGILFGAALSIIVSIPEIINQTEISSIPKVNPISLLLLALSQFFNQLSTTAIPEEIFFRGFLWGSLMNFGWKVSRVVVFQGLLFWLAHYNYDISPYRFLVTIPFGTLLLSFLTLRTSLVNTSIVAHATYNTTEYLLILLAEL